MSAKPQLYCLQWNDYTTHITDLFLKLLDTNCLVDVTLCVEHKTIFAHRIILSACSIFFQEIFSSASESHPIVILGDMGYDDVKAIIEFMYRGELSIRADQVGSVLNVARELKVRGLMEVSGQVLGTEVAAAAIKPSILQEGDCNHELATDENEAGEVQEPDFQLMEREEELVSHTDKYLIKNAEQSLAVSSAKQLELKWVEAASMEGVDDDEKKSKLRKDPTKKSYSEVIMNEALNDIRSGRSLQEISDSRKIPRSTLYFRARSQGVPLSCPRQEHSQEKVNAALQAITGGSSLQQAAREYKIPKTVLWRRMQKEGEEYVAVLRNRNKSRHDAVKKQAAIQALENGANLSKVSSQYLIPKATLFREKSRLVEAGRLPLECLRKRQQSDDGFKQQRLAEAVAACKGGKMSQAAASNTYKVSKTTIWRRMQSGKEKVEDSKNAAKESNEQRTELIETEEIQESKLENIVVELDPGTEFSVVDDNSSEMPITYMEVSDFADASLIILTSSSGDETISLPVEENQIIVDPDGNQIL